MSRIQNLTGYFPNLADFKTSNVYYRKLGDAVMVDEMFDHRITPDMVKNFENKYAIYRPELPEALEKYAEIAVNDRYKYGNKLQSKIIIDSHSSHLTLMKQIDICYINDITSAIFILIGKDNSRALCHSVDPASLGIALPHSKARRNAVIGGLKYYQAFTREQGAFLEEWMKHIVIDSTADMISGNTIYLPRERYARVGKETIYSILDNDQKSFNAYLKPYWRHTHTFGYEFNTDKCYIFVGNSQIIQMRADVDSYICDFARTIELTCKLNGVKLLSHYQMFPKNGKPFVCGIAEDKFGKRGCVKLILKHYRFDVFIDGNIHFEYNRSHLSLDEWTLYGRGFSQYPGYYPSSQITYRDFDGDDVIYNNPTTMIFNGIGFEIKPTISEFDFKPAYKTSMLVPYGQLYKGVDYSNIQTKDIYDKNPSIKHIRKIKK